MPLAIGRVTPPPAPESSNLEQISEIYPEQEIQGYLHGHAREITNHYLVKKRGTGDDPIALDLNRVPRNLDFTINAEVGIAEVDSKLRVFPAGV